MENTMRIIQYKDLESAKGIPYSRAHVDRLEKAGKFPKRVKLSEGRYAAAGWLESEIDAWIAERVAERDKAAAA